MKVNAEIKMNTAADIRNLLEGADYIEKEEKMSWLKIKAKFGKLEVLFNIKKSKELIEVLDRLILEKMYK